MKTLLTVLLLAPIVAFAQTAAPPAKNSAATPASKGDAHRN